MSKINKYITKRGYTANYNRDFFTKMTEVFIFTESTSVLQVKRDKFIEHFDVPSNWNVSLITDMSNLFANTQCNFSLHTWDVSNVTNMENV